jgi:ABC-type multidrug transport system fused ATPase/permease subunit
MQFFDRTPQGRVITRLTHDVEGIEDFFTTAIGKVLGAIFTGIVALVAMIYTSGWSGVIIFSSIIPAFFLLYGTRTMQGKLNRGMGRSTSMINGQLSEFISGQEVIRSLGLERWSMEQFKLTALFQRNIHLESNLYFSWSRPVLSFLCTLPIVGLVWLGGNQVLSGVMSVGVFVAFLRYCERFINPVMVVARDFHIVQQALINAERVAQFLKRPPEDEVFGLDGQHQNAIIRGSIEFNNVGLIYSGAQGRAIDKVTFNVLPGERIGIVGKTGSGKSSVIALLARLYEYQEGSILIDQVEMRQWRRAHLRRHIGVVAQDPVLFRGSIRDNLALELEFTPEQIAECTMQTGLSHVLARSGLSLDSMILDAGVNLSVGERQLVVITRMLLRNPAILILDEATANIDPYHEHIVHEAINRLMTGRTCLIVAHRLATLKECHRVLVFSQGHLVEEGTLEELEQRRGYFYQLQCAQGTAELL